MLLETGHIFRKYAFFTPSPLSEASLWQSKCGCTCRLSRCPLSVRRLSGIDGRIWGRRMLSARHLPPCRTSSCCRCRMTLGSTPPPCFGCKWRNPLPWNGASPYNNRCLSTHWHIFEAVRYTPRSLVANRCSRLQRSCPCCFEDLGRWCTLWHCFFVLDSVWWCKYMKNTWYITC